LGLVAIALGLLAAPVWMLTREGPAPVVEASPLAMVPEKMETYAVLLTATSPAVMRVMAASRPVVSSGGEVKSFETQFEMNAAQPEDIAVFADFADRSSTHAFRVEVFLDGETVVDTTFWGEGLIEDVVVVPEP
jgi:hypothetical protein